MAYRGGGHRSGLSSCFSRVRGESNQIKEELMKVHYFQETDSLYIDLTQKLGVDSREVVPGVILDLDAAGQVVGIDIDHASKIVDLSKLEAEALPLES
jgi:uncharacterized protein YuzE